MTQLWRRMSSGMFAASLFSLVVGHTTHVFAGHLIVYCCNTVFAGHFIVLYEWRGNRADFAVILWNQKPHVAILSHQFLSSRIM